MPQFSLNFSTLDLGISNIETQMIASCKHSFVFLQFQKVQSRIMDRRGRDQSKSSSTEDSVYRIAPYFYLHVLDQNSNVTRVEIGPKTYVRQDNEKVF